MGKQPLVTVPVGGAVIGALGADTREDRFYIFQAKAILLGTGKCSRLYRITRNRSTQHSLNKHGWD